MEYLEDTLEDDSIPTGPDGRPIRKVRYRGVEIYKTGDPMFDAFEREWAEQDVEELDAQIQELAQRNAPVPEKDDIDVLRELGYTLEDLKLQEE